MGGGVPQVIRPFSRDSPILSTVFASYPQFFAIYPQFLAEQFVFITRLPVFLIGRLDVDTPTGGGRFLGLFRPGAWEKDSPHTALPAASARGERRENSFLTQRTQSKQRTQRKDRDLIVFLCVLSAVSVSSALSALNS
jgi:hypothetical protein